MQNNKVVVEEWRLTGKKNRFRDVTYINNMPYVITDDATIYRIAKK